MQTFIPTSEFINTERGDRAFNAVCKAIQFQEKMWLRLIGTFGDERYYRVRMPGRDRRCVIIWQERTLGIDVASCTCEAHYIPQTPTPCWHIAGVLIYEAEHRRKQASMGRKESNGRRSTQRKKKPVSTHRGSAPAGKVEG